MRKFQWLMIVLLISGIVAFASCRRMEQMLDPVMPDAEKVEPPAPTETPEEMVEMPEEMMEMPVNLVDVLIYTNRSFWITLEDAEMAAETTKRRLDSHGVQVHITKNDAYVREWMLHTTGDGNMNVIVLYGVLPAAVYGTGNSQPDGSIAENWIETMDGDTVLNHADYIAYNTDYDVDKITEWNPIMADGPVEAGEVQAVGSNVERGLRNLMDNPNISLFAPVPNPRVIGASTGGPISMVVTSDGMALAPSLVDFESYRPIPLNQLQGEWFAEKVFASDTGNAEAAYADPVIVRDGNLGRLAIVHATTEHVGLQNGDVAAEIIINYLLAPPMMEQPVETPPEPMVEMPEMVELKKLYWGDSGSGLIQRSNPDGSNVETLITGVKPWGIELDIEGGKIYWVSWANQRLSRANLDGSNVEVLVAGETFQELAIDLEAGKIYWSGSGKIQRANLDGSEVEDIITSPFYPDGIALDLVNGKIYWTEWTEFPPNPDELTDTIQRANLDGSDIEVLVTGLLVPQAITLDLDGGKIYWTNWPPVDTIQRANLDGTNIEDVLPGTGGLHDIVFDFSEGKFYWADTSTTYIQRANADGSEVEIVVSGLVAPRTVALDIGPIN